MIGRYRRNPELRSMASDRMERVLERLIAKAPYVQYCYVCNMHGRKVTRTIVQQHDAEKFAGWSEEDFSDREWFQQPLKDGRSTSAPLHLSSDQAAVHNRVVDARGPDGEERRGCAGDRYQL